MITEFPGIPSDVALSTSWNAWRHNGGKDIVEEIKKLGFRSIELNYAISEKEIREIAVLQKNGVVNITSLHNCCPFPAGLNKKNSMDFYSLSAIEEKERKTAVSWTKNTIDWADTLGAKAVILHLSGLTPKPESGGLIELFNKGKKETEEYKRLRKEIIANKKKRSGKYFESALKSLEEINFYLGGADIKVGVENRYYYEQIPDFDELGTIFRYFESSSNISYWHDTGHAQVLDNLGFFTHSSFLEAYSQRLIGFHLHDIFMTFDHKPPGLGEMDFSILKDYLKKDCLKVMEINGAASPKEIILGYFSLTNLKNAL